jgi:hypothetical protein
MRTPAGEARRFASCSIRHFTRLTFINSNIVAQAKVSSSRFIHCLKRETLERDDYTPCTRHQPASTRQCGANHRDRGNQIRWLQHFIFRQKPAGPFLGKPRRGSPAIDAARLNMEPHPLTCSARIRLHANTVTQAWRMRHETPASPPTLSQRERVRNGHDAIETSSCRINNGACATIAIAAGYAGVSFVACPLSCSGNQFDKLVKHSPNKMANQAKGYRRRPALTEAAA